MYVTTFKPSTRQIRLPVPNRGLLWIGLCLWGLAPALVTATEAIPPEKAVIKLTPKFGPVTFTHQRHSDLEGVDCTTCHHTMRTMDGPIRSCYVCHEAVYFSIANIRKAEPGRMDDIEPSVRNAQEAFHGLCTGCHKHRRQQNLPAGPDDSCRDCHN
ncbi:MAG: cytochrome c3 family protein [Gammaproteobacteria bacterium]